MTIPASSIHLNGDGTAWLIVDETPTGTTAGRETAQRMARPCDSCNGDEWMIEPDGDDPGCHCDGCVNGRHTFTVEVECHICHNDPERIRWCSAAHWPTLRVSIREGMVLKVFDHPLRGGNRSGIELGNQDADHESPNTRWWHGQWSPLGELPPDAKSGMWAVLLDVHDFSENTKEAP
jgi:hypothetical protein